MGTGDGSNRSQNTLSKLMKGVVNKRVLLVEDNYFNQEVVLSYLRDLGVSYGIASNGREAIEELLYVRSAEQYGLILMDCQMPEMDGYEATKLIRSGRAGACDRDIPIIAVTANVSPGDRDACLSAGMNDYLSKPISYEQLVNKLVEWLSDFPYERRESEEFIMAETEDSLFSSKNVIWDEAKYLQRLKNNKQRAVELIELFLTMAPDQINELENVKDEHARLLNVVQKIKGSALNIYAPQLVESTRLLEISVREERDEESQTFVIDLKAKYLSLNDRLIEFVQEYYLAIGKEWPINKKVETTKVPKI